MREAVPGQLLAELRQQIVGEQAHCPQQSIQDVTEVRLGNGRETMMHIWCFK